MIEKSPLISILVKNIKDSKDKSLVVIGVHDGLFIKELGRHFKKVFSCYEFLKIKEIKKGNICVIKEPFSITIKKLKNFDVIMFVNEMHHLPDIFQLRTYYNLKKNQELILIEWAKKGTLEKFYNYFQYCGQLCDLSKRILDQMIKQGIVKIEKKQLFRDEITFENKKEMEAFFKFILPDHYGFGRLSFLKKLNQSRFPLHLTDVNYFYKIRGI
ncbi:MAG: hypothetical protein NTX24_02495 [Candidatus Pacearchaeota archaeon]|nr:hypothetical protein [Candidatus Pacearchaeota archaeon]